MRSFDPGLDVRARREPMGFDVRAGRLRPLARAALARRDPPEPARPRVRRPDPVYAIAMDVGREEHRAELQRRHLLFGVVTYAAGRLGEEPVRSQGHVHRVASRSGWSPPELYEIWAGRAVVYMQEQAEDDPGRCFAIEAGPGEVVVVPPGWAHATVSADAREPMTFGAWCDREYGFEYAEVRARGGLAFFPLLPPRGASSGGGTPATPSGPSSSAGRGRTRSSGSSPASPSTGRSRATRRRCSGSPTPPASRTCGRVSSLSRVSRGPCLHEHDSRPGPSGPGSTSHDGGTDESHASRPPAPRLRRGPARAERVTLPLNGAWQIADSVAAEPAPTVFRATVAVPGLVHNATPAFPDVDAFDSLELVNNKIAQKLLPESARVAAPGVTRQKRNYFWYRRTFTAPARKAVATLRVNKAQFGTAVWLNGTKVGEYAGCFSAGVFDLTEALKWAGENVLLVRIGAHPGVLPATFPAGTDFEKLKWTPGIYDEVSLQLADNPVIESVQVAPRVASQEILVETKLANRGAHPVTFELAQSVKAWKGGNPGGSRAEAVTLAPGESRAVRQTIPVREPTSGRRRTRSSTSSTRRPAGTRSPRASGCASSGTTRPRGARS